MYKFRISFFSVLLVLSLLFLPFSPLITLLLSVGGIVIANNKVELLIQSLPTILSFSLIAVSRDFFTVYNDDFQTYYDIYNNLSNNFFHFHAEIGTNVVNSIILALLGDIPPRVLSLIYCIICISIIIFSIFRFFNKLMKFSVNNCCIFIALFILFTPFFAPTIFIRQYFSISFFVLAISYSDSKKSWFYYMISFFFHHSILFLIILKILTPYLISSRKRILTTMIVLISTALLFNKVVNHLLDGIPKLRAWLILEKDFSFISFLSHHYFLVILLVALTILPRINNKHSNNRILFERLLLLIISISFFLDYTIPYISVRTFLLFFIFTGVLLGVFTYVLNTNKALLILIFLSLGYAKQIAISTDLQENDSYSSLYRAYPAVSLHPFYYIDPIILDIQIRNREKI